MIQTPQDPSQSPSGPGWLWVTGFILISILFFGFSFWRLAQRDLTSVTTACLAYSVAAGVMSLTLHQAQQKRAAANVPDDDNALCVPQFGPLFYIGIASAIVALVAIIGFVPRPAKIMAALVMVLIVTFAVMAFAWQQALRKGGPAHEMRPAGRRYMMRFLPAMIIYSAVFVAATWYYRAAHPTGIAALLTALAPSVPVLYAIRAMLLLLREETDEYLRLRGYEVWALATGMALALCTVWGFLDQFRVVPHLPLWAVFPLWACCLIPAHLIVGKRYA